MYFGDRYFRITERNHVQNEGNKPLYRKQSKYIAKATNSSNINCRMRKKKINNMVLTRIVSKLDNFIG